MQPHLGHSITVAALPCLCLWASVFPAAKWACGVGYNSCPACCGPSLGSENVRVVKDASPSVVWEAEAVLGRLHCCAGFGALGHWAGPGQPGRDTLILPGTQTRQDLRLTSEISLLVEEERTS